MMKLASCPCGFEVRSAVDEQIVSAIKSHAWTTHERSLTDEQVRAIIRPVEPHLPER
jgi:predicted small metal-binding protein